MKDKQMHILCFSNMKLHFYLKPIKRIAKYYRTVI